MTTETSSAHDVTLLLMRALIDEIHAAAHDPAVVHLVADKLKSGIDILEKSLVQAAGGDKEKEK